MMAVEVASNAAGGFAFLEPVGDLLPNMLSTFVIHQIIDMITHDHK